ncbi:hypothetical protein BT63DRAFT_183798 [Microthyrium microscopicum]|uniref:UDENN FLCN/SMCR8-type domain-containing protein n=1 Tax=Microthyrium microscopicum TaxID=703497 RepID=A0A6A6ULY5_9PEZI|nr:hypothetical protein BT63DRAFT_183798 [Microthyrium microscopicum]
MDFIVSLAHFCETHGPTTVLCTQLSPISCRSCFPVSLTPSNESLSKNGSFSSGFWDPPSPVVTPGTGPLFSPFTSPPTSPRSPNAGYNPYFGNFPSDAASARRLSFSSEADGDACDSCNLIVPKNKVKGLSEGDQSPMKQPRRQTSSTVLRSIHTIAAYGSAPGPNTKEEDESSPEDTPTWPSSRYGTSPEGSQTSAAGSNGSSPIYQTPNTHIHNLTYVTRRQPESQSLYSRLRHSCVRTLTSESLPRGSPCGAFSFGDPIAGHTIAYIFRLRDPRARGKRRTYALTALVGDNCRAMAAFVPITKAFEAIANSINNMADQVLERESILLNRPSVDYPQTPPLSASLPMQPTSPTSPSGDRSRTSTSSPVSDVRLAEPSSFLTAKKIDPFGFPRMSRDAMRPKGLPEIVGREDFFADLHVKFCHILYELVTKMPR